MGSADYDKLADRLDEEADAMQRHNDELRDEVADAREDWERKRADPNVPGAPQPAEDSASEPDSEASSSPGPEAPPPDAHPAEAETPDETAAGPPADTGTDD